MASRQEHDPERAPTTTTVLTEPPRSSHHQANTLGVTLAHKGGLVKLTIPREFFNRIAGMQASQKTVNSIYLTSKLYGHFGTQTAPSNQISKKVYIFQSLCCVLEVVTSITVTKIAIVQFKLKLGKTHLWQIKFKI